ncbi:MAG: hypothetical protein KGS61_21440, partial [Verrucomicrobia bacterium]|nr:hypothetical protein [Verrucomicrobiota bacterium]
LIRAVHSRTWTQGAKQAKEVLNIIFGTKVPYERARRMLPTLEEMTAILYPGGAHPGFPVDFGRAKLLQMLSQTLAKALRERATNPEFAFTSRTDLGLYSLLHQLGARVDNYAAWQRATGA